MSSLIRATWFSGLTSIVNVSSQILKGKAQAIFLGTSGMGVLSQCLYFFNLFNIVAGLGLSEGVVRYTSEFKAKDEKEHLESFHITIFTILFCSSTFVSLLALLYADFFSFTLFNTTANSKYVAITIIALPFAILARFFNSILTGTKEVKKVAQTSIFANLLSLPLSILLIYLYNITGAILGIAIFHCTAVMIGYRFVLKGHLFNLKRFSVKLINLKYFYINKWYSVTGLTMVLMATLTMIYISKSIIIGLGIDQNGIYATTIKVSSVYFGMLFGAASTYYYPTLCSLNVNKEIVQEINNTLHYYVVILTPVIISLIVFNHPLMILLFSPKFIPAGALLAYHLPGDMLRIIYETMGLALLAKGKLKAYVILYAFWCLLYILLAKTLGSQLSLTGFSCAYTGAYLVSVCLAYFCVARIFQFRFTRKSLFYSTLSMVFLLAAAVNDIYVSSGIKYLSGSLLLILWMTLVSRDPAFKQGANRILKKLGGK